MKGSKLLENGIVTPLRLIGSNNYFCKIIADVFPPWHCVNTHLNAPDQQTDKPSAFIEVLTLADDYQHLDVSHPPNSYGGHCA